MSDAPHVAGGQDQARTWPLCTSGEELGLEAGLGALWPAVFPAEWHWIVLFGPNHGEVQQRAVVILPIVWRAEVTLSSVGTIGDAWKAIDETLLYSIVLGN